MLESAGLKPGLLIGGVPANFPVSARLGGSPVFVIEADEYDCAFFDKRSKFVHFRPRTLVINNLEHDHADIFPDLAAIQRQFHHLVRTVPRSGLIIANGDQVSVRETLAMGCWSEVISSGQQAVNTYRLQQRGDAHVLTGPNIEAAELRWAMSGAHNASNAVNALLAARHVGVRLEDGLAALGSFRGIRRRQELRGEVGGVEVYDDFAHHPTAIAATIESMRPAPGRGRLIAVLEPRSNTMRLGTHREALPDSLAGAERVWLYQSPGMDWSVAELCAVLGSRADWRDDIDALVQTIVAEARPGDRLLVMSNGGFDNIHERLLAGLAERRTGASMP
jgi:UDP-N-acetylmuramate: L-alanyl-gamma-D-glutamyl-meso-diaminopimelate ligase